MKKYVKDKMEQMKRHLWNFIYTIRFFFCPFYTIGFCLVSTILIDTVLMVPMFLVDSQSVWFDVLFALVTGVTASFGVSVAIEISSNYRRNKLRALELREYFGVFLSYEINKKTFLRSNEDMEQHDELYDEIKVIWRELPKLIPVFQRTLNEKKEHLTYKEIEALQNLLSEFNTVKGYMKTRLKTEDIFEERYKVNDSVLDGWIPLNLKELLSEEYLRQLCVIEFDEAYEKVIEKMFSSEETLSIAMANDISVGLKYLQVDEFDHLKEKKQEEDDWEDSQILSMCCWNILEEIKVLEKYVKKQPVEGYMIAWVQKK